MKTIRVLFLISAVGAMAACGGGGGSSPAPAPEGAPPPPASASAPIGPAGSGFVTAYDPSDPDTLLAVPLTHALVASNAPGPVGDKGTARVEIGGTPKYDAQAGVTMGSANPTYLRFLDIAGIDRLSTTGWQLYFEVDRRSLALLPAASPGSNGIAIPSTQYLVDFSRQSDDVSTMSYAFNVSPEKYATFASGSGSGVGTAGIPYNDAVLPASQTHVPIVLWGNHDKTGVIIDGVAAGPLESASSLGIAQVLALTAADTSKVRNLLLVARPPVFVENPALKTMAVFGDSYAQFDSDYLHSATFSASAYLQALAQVTKAGRTVQWTSDGTEQVHPGTHVMGFNTATAPRGIAEPANGSGDNLWDQKDQMLASLSPAILVMQAGANDVSLDGSQPDVGRWQAWVLEWARWALGEGGYAKSSIRKFAFCTTPWSPTVGGSTSVRQQRLARIQAMQQATLAAVAQFRQLYPDRAGDVLVIDQYAAFGAGATPASYFSDSASSDGGVHPSVLGNIVKGQSWGRGVAGLLAD